MCIFFDDMAGQWSPLARKSIEPMALRIQETDLVDKGRESVGVARRYCGPLGKVECAGRLTVPQLRMILAVVLPPTYLGRGRDVGVSPLGTATQSPCLSGP